MKKTSAQPSISKQTLEIKESSMKLSINQYQQTDNIEEVKPRIVDAFV